MSEHTPVIETAHWVICNNDYPREIFIGTERECHARVKELQAKVDDQQGFYAGGIFRRDHNSCTPRIFIHSHLVPVVTAQCESKP